MTHRPAGTSSIDNHGDAHDLDSLHARVNAMLDLPLPKEGDAFLLPLEAPMAFGSLHGTFTAS